MDDIIEQILLLLPVKSVTQCKCLSKKWNHLISFNSHFHHAYLSRLTSGTPPILGFFFNEITNAITGRNTYIPPTYSVGFAPLNTLTPKPHSSHNRFGFKLRQLCGDYNMDKIVAASNGFLVFRLKGDYPSRQYYIYNPITEEGIALPFVHSSGFSSCEVGFIYQGDHPCLNRVSYKVVRRKHNYVHGTVTLYIFSSESFEWKILNRTYTSLHTLDSAVISKEKIIYLLAIIREFNPLSYSIIVVDESKEELEFISIPTGTFSVYNCGIGIGLVDGLLFCAQDDEHQLQVLVMGEKGKWLKCRINLYIISRSPIICDDWRRTKFAGFHPINSQILFFKSNNAIISYNAEDSRTELLCDMNRRLCGGYQFFPYIWHFHEFLVVPENKCGDLLLNGNVSTKSE